VERDRSALYICVIITKSACLPLRRHSRDLVLRMRSRWGWITSTPPRFETRKCLARR
jgi:hypothetical protein